MTQVAIEVNGKSYPVECDEGQEQHLQYLAEQVNNRVKQLSESMGQIGENRLLLLTCLLQEDEVAELKKQCQNVSNDTQSDQKEVQQSQKEYEAKMSEVIDNVARKIELVAENLKKV